MTTMKDLRTKLESLPPQVLRRIARLGTLHARLMRKARKAHGLTRTQAKVLAHLDRAGIGI